MTTARDIIGQIVELDEQIASLRARFEELPPKEQVEVLTAQFAAAVKKTREEDPVSFSVLRCAEMMGELDSPAVAQTLAEGLGHANADVRLISGDALHHMAEHGLDRIMPAVESALEDDGLRAEEMPFLLVDVEEPEVVRVVERFLSSPNAEVVASAIEALAELGDASAVDALEKLRGDTRKVSVDEDESPQADWTVGQLVEDAIDMLSVQED